MGERCFLEVHNQPEPIGEDKSVEFKIGMAFEADRGGVPLLWLALFSKEHLIEVRTKAYFLEADAPEVIIPTLFAKSSDALDVFRQRLPLLRKITHEALWPFIDLFQQAVQDCGYQYIQADLHSLWAVICDKNSELLRSLILQELDKLELVGVRSNEAGPKQIEDTSDLYGLPSLLPPFEGDIDLPWCHVASDGSVVPSEPSGT